MEFHVGQRVKATCHISIIRLQEDVGTIVSATHSSSSHMYGVAFDRNVGGHDCDGFCNTNHGWYLSAEYLTPIDFSVVNIEEII